GGLVPGVTIHGYMTRPALDALGPEWLERGTISTRFIKPFYQDELVTVRTRVTSADESGAAVELTAVNERGETCAIGTATLPAERPIPPSSDDVPAAPMATTRPDSWTTGNGAIRNDPSQPPPG
ncbi:MAG TPA: hotdog fold domain-containing protein, partial [Flavobacteriales bacterium]|nr:hotdog fold domain-containing protein [Flavobacteriales bacterium]